MQCAAILASGNRCRRDAAPPAQMCSRHTRVAQPHAFYAQRFARQARKALKDAAHLEGLVEEIAVLRTLIRDLAAAGDADAARRGIEALARVLRTQQQRGAPADELASWVEDTLDELEAENTDPWPPPRHHRGAH